MATETRLKPSLDASWIKTVPIAHRGLHDATRSIYENTLSAAKAAIDHGYAIEVDLQPSADGVPMVFHDYELERMTGVTGRIREVPASKLQTMKIGDSDDTIPSFAELLKLVQGRSSLVVELKGFNGDDEGFVEAVAKDLAGYRGNVAIMSFNHHILADAREIAPHLTLGLTAEGGDKAAAIHEEIVAKTDPDFLSYELENAGVAFVEAFAESGKPVITWTVRSPQDAAVSAKHADQITFEGFLP